VAKIAWDAGTRGRSVHLELAGLLSRVSFFNPLNGRNFSTMGGGGAINVLFQPAPRLTFITTNYYSRGGGNFIFGQIPNLIIQGSGAPSLLPSASTVDGLEVDLTTKWKLWAYYGGTFGGTISTIDPSTSLPVGYGYTGSPNSQNRSIQQVSGGFTRILWANPNYGTFRLSGEYSWLVRHPWYVASGQPASANLNMVYLGLRYVLPGKPPGAK
jgi:hypothetical protein